MRAIAGIVLAALIYSPALCQSTAPPPPKAQVLAAGVWLIPGGIQAKRQPDGNTVIFQGPRGLVVMDTGRHPWHRQAILDFANDQGLPIVAIVNSHWHLDHVSGDPALKAAYPASMLYASRAIDEALTGFLARSAADAEAYLASSQATPEAAEDIRGDVATTKAGEALKPDIAIDASDDRALAGLKLRVNLAADAATAGDVWIYDPASRIAAVGDLVTLPAPFLDTACPKGWIAALDQVWATPFLTLVPGHGATMTRMEFALYRNAFNQVIDCAATARAKSECAAAWTQGVRPLLGKDPADARRAQSMTEYYVQDVLRANGGKSASCRTA